MTEEQYLEILELGSKKQKKLINLNYKKDIITKYNLNLHPDTFRKAQQTIFGGAFIYEYFKHKKNIKNNVNELDLVINNYKSENSINKDGSYTSDKLLDLPENELVKKDSLLKAHGFDIKDWQLVSARNNVWNVYSKQDGIKKLFSSKIVIKPRTDISTEEIKEFYIDLLQNYSSPIVKKYQDNKSDILVELPIFDLHLGKYSTSDIVKETYNTEEARRCFNFVIDNVIERLKGKKIKKVIFPIGNDFFHYDTFFATTTNGTQQYSDLKHQTLFKTGVLLLIDGISKLSKELKTKVDVFCVAGNHDFITSYHATMSLWCYFTNNENVNVDVNLETSPRKYVKFGKCLIGFAHGDKEKKRIDKLMQQEVPKWWGSSIFREWHLGHLHSEKMRGEDGGIIIRNLPSVCGTDEWHHNSGYVGAIRKCPCFIWKADTGLDTIFHVVITNNLKKDVS